MVELTADLFISLDGFAKGVDSGPFFGYPGPDLDTWVGEALDWPHLELMGRVTYQAMAAMSAAATDPASTRMNEAPKAVFSNTLREPLRWPNTRLIAGDLAEQIRALKQQSAVPVRTIGSLTLVRGLIQHGLVDRLRLMVFPLALGDAGREPIWTSHPTTTFDLIGTKILDSRLVLLEYRPTTPASA